MVELNRHRFKTLYEKAERIIKELSHMKEIWVPWVALGCIDTDQLCSVHLTNWQSWDRNFKACKHFSQQIAKIQE
jgi:dynein heavy chain 2, cytosolic